MNLSNLAIRRPLTIMMIITAMLMFGAIAIPKMALEYFPDMNIPVAMVVTSVDGGTPSEVEKLVTKPIEGAVGTVSNVKSVQSTSMEGASQVIIQFNWGENIDQGVTDLRDKVDQVRGSLPDTAHSPRILKFDPNSQSIVNIALTGDNDPNVLRKYAEDNVQKALERVNGVGSVSITGGQDREVDVILDPNKIQAYGLTIDQIKQALSSTNQSGSVGSVREGDSKMQIRVQGEYKDVSQIGRTPIPTSGGASIRLGDISTIQDTHAQITQKTTYNGNTSVTLGILKATGGNTVQVVDGVKKELQNLEKTLPAGYKFTISYDSSTFIKDSVSAVAEHGILGVLCAVMILYLFLNSVKSALIVSIVMPISLVTTFALMYVSGQTFNIMSLSGLTLGMGSLIDFAVVIIENIFRYRQRGYSMLEAAKEGSAQIGTAVMASALAQIVVFLPITFTQGIAGKIFGPLALAVVFSHAAALIVSFMLVPMLSSRWLNELTDEEIYHSGTYKGRNPVIWFNIGFEKMAQGYGRLLHWALNNRKKVIVATISLFVGAAALVPHVGMEFMPKSDQGQISVSIKMPNGTVLVETEKVTSVVENAAKSLPELKNLAISMGSAGGYSSTNASQENKAIITINLVDKKERNRSTEQVTEELRKTVSTVPGAEITVKESDNSGVSSGSPVQISLAGDDLATLEDISKVIASEVTKIQGTRNIQNSLEDTVSEYEIKVDPEKADLYGLTTSQIVSFVRTAFNGQTVTKYRTGNDEIDINLKYPESIQSDIGYLNSLRITTSNGAQVALTSVASISKQGVPQTIQREDQERKAQITSDIVGRPLGDVMADIQKKLNALSLPQGYQISYGGDSKNMSESFNSLGLAIILSIVLMYMVMVAQFESLFNPFIIMFSIPPTLIGVVVGLFITGKSLSINAITGYILLIGLVVNNAIVLLDLVNSLRKDGVERNTAIMKAGPSRLRPIMMTTLATILAVVPIAVGGGSGNESQAPMAIVVIFGLSFSTLITLVLVPVVYTLFEDIRNKMKNRRSRRKKGRAEEQQVS
ncbi:MAG TPA: efflux RND transporter permease subunit [Bacillota bacterium]|nr:efflux RND transporter permease subunit [Bacillota bacterium]